MVEVELHPYSPGWPALFEIERASIEAALGDSALDEHADWILMHRDRVIDQSEVWRMGS